MCTRHKYFLRNNLQQSAKKKNGDWQFKIESFCLFFLCSDVLYNGNAQE